MFPGEPLSPSALVEADEEERRKAGEHYNRGREIHSTGRGGIANMSTSPPPAIERYQHVPGGFESTGRGGDGNIKERSKSIDVNDAT